jgi:fatty acid desaturase
MSTVKLNWLAILVAALASIFLELVWLSIFMIPWLAGVGRSKDWILALATVNPAVQYGAALLCSLIAAIVLSVLTQLTGPQTARRGILVAILVWLGFVATTWAREYIFEVRTFQIYFINAGYSLLDLILMGAITGAWKAKRPTNP